MIAIKKFFFPIVSIIVLTIIFVFGAHYLSVKSENALAEKSDTPQRTMLVGLKNQNMYGTNKKNIQLQHQYLNKMKKKHINSYLLAVENNSVSLQTANGLAKQDVNWTGDTQFRVSSLQKLLTLDLLLELVKSDKVSLTNTVGELITPLNKTSISNVTISSLISKKSDIYMLKKHIVNKDYYDLMAEFKTSPNSFKRSKSGVNINYLLLAMIVETVGDKDYITLAQNNILLKNGLDQSTFVSSREINSQLAIPYNRNKNSVNYNSPVAHGDFIFGIDDLCMSATNMYELLDKSVGMFADSNWITRQISCR